MSKTAEELFEEERSVLEKALREADKPSYVGNDLLPLYKELTKKYEKLLRQSEKILRISDKNQAIVKTLQDNLRCLLETTEEEAEAANIAKSRFLCNMSHELRTPLNGILGFAQVLSNTDLDHEQSQYLGYIIEASRMLKDVIGNILDISRIEAGQIETFEKPINLRAVCRDVLSSVQFQATEKGLDLRLNLDDEIPEVLIADHFHLQQALLHLVANAVKFTETGSVSLSVRSLREASGKEEGTLLLFTVEDTGIGMPPVILDKVCKPFVQADDSMTRKYGGCGLGLAITRGFLETMGSTLHVESESGKGSSFSFSLALRRSIDI